MQTGIIDPVARTFDIYNVDETEPSVLLTNTQLSLTYRNEAGQLIKLVKPVSQQLGTYAYKRTISDPRDINVGTTLSSGSTTENGYGGYLEPSTRGRAPSSSR